MNESNSTVVPILWVIILLFVVLFIPTTIWSGIILRGDWNSVYIIKRRQTLVLCTYCGLSLVATLRVICFPLPLLLFPKMTNSTFLFIDSGILLISTIPGTFFLGWTVITRIWVFYFDSMLLDFESNKEWRMAIDPTKEDPKYNWFTQNINKWGNTTYLIKRITIVTIIESSLFALAYLINYKELGEIFANIVLAICFAVRISLGLYWFKLIRQRGSEDNIGILKEIKTVSIGMLGLITGVLGVATISVLTNMSSLHSKLYFVLFTMIACCIYIYLSVPYCRKLFNEYCESPINFAFENIQSMTKNVEKHKLSSNDNNNNSNGEIDGNVNKLQLRKIESKSPKVINKKIIISWRDVVATYDGYVLFMNHLGKEWSTENMLFIQEVTYVVTHFIFLQFGM